MMERVETVDEACKRLGLKTYDTALPQPWVDKVYEQTGVWPCGLVVWCYDGASIFGYPRAICSNGDDLLLRYNESSLGLNLGLNLQ